MRSSRMICIPCGDLLAAEVEGQDLRCRTRPCPAAGSNQAAQLYLQFGEDFVRRLYLDQKPPSAATPGK